MLAGTVVKFPRAWVSTRTFRCSSYLAPFGAWIHGWWNHSRRLRLGRIGATGRGLADTAHGSRLRAQGSGKIFEISPDAL